MINGNEITPTTGKIEALPISDMLTHLATLAKQREDAGDQFKCVAILMVDQDGSWAGAVGGAGAGDLSALLHTARDSLVRGEDTFMVYVKIDDPAQAETPAPEKAANDGEQNG
jgi:hypothetical protein